MRGGLDDALEKLARRDELRRRAAGEATGTPPAVQELVETIAGVVGRNPQLEVTVGVEGAGDPTLLHFFVEGGTVQVNVDPSVASRVTAATRTTPKHADFELDPDDAVDTTPATPAYQGTGSAERDEAGQETRRLSYRHRDHSDLRTEYATTPYDDPDPYPPAQSSYDLRDSAFPTADTAAAENPYLSPFAATPPPPVPAQTTRRIRPEQHRAPEQPAAAERGPATARPGAEPAPAEERGMPQALPEPIPLTVDAEETDKAAKRLAALLRDNPTLLRPGTPD